MKSTYEGKKCPSDHHKEWKKGKKTAKYRKKRNIPKSEFAGVKKTRRYKADVEKLLAKATKEKEDVAEKASKIASILQSEIQRQVKFASGTKPAAPSPSVVSSEIEFKNALGSLFQSKDKSK